MADPIEPIADAPELPLAEPLTAPEPPEPVEPIAAAPEPEPPKPTEPKRAVPKGVQERFGELTRKASEAEAGRAAERARAERAEALLAALGTPPAKPDEPPAPRAEPLRTADMSQAQIEEAAHRIVSQREFTIKRDAILTDGTKKFTDFNEACNLLSDMGANERPELLQITTDLPNGAEILHHLGTNPDEAARVLKLPALKMAIELDRLSTKLAVPLVRAISSAPAPIKPIDGTARATDEITGDEPMSDFARKWNKKRAESNGRGAKF